MEGGGDSGGECCCCSPAEEGGRDWVMYVYRVGRRSSRGSYAAGALRASQRELPVPSRQSLYN